MIRGLEHLSQGDGLRELGLFTGEKNVWGHLTAALRELIKRRKFLYRQIVIEQRF